MLFYLFSAEELEALFARLGYPFERAAIRRTIEYYLARSAHDSTPSRVTDSWVLARADRPRSWDVFQEALISDVADIQGGTLARPHPRDGIHVSAVRCAAPEVKVGVRDKVYELRAGESMTFDLPR